MTISQKNIENGVQTIRDFAKKLPNGPGIYQMLDAEGRALYVGKARNLQKRVTSYTNPGRLTPRLQRMVAATTAMEFITTHTEAEALLLEANLIKKRKPKFNVLLRDDKSFPYILVTKDHDFPQVTKHRGAQKRKGHYFGPFATAGSVNQTITTLQRAFLLRNCSDNVFAARHRPCLQYQIKRCTAPCVGKVSKEEYAEQVKQAHDFLAGKTRQIQDRFVKKMNTASDVQDYEEAAKYRDRIRALTAVQARQLVNVQGLGDADIIALYQDNDQSCVEVFFFRGGCNYGNRAFFPAHEAGTPPEEVIGVFLGQFYAKRPPPKTILLSHKTPDQAVIAEALSLNAGHKVMLSVPQRGDRRKIVEQAGENAKAALARRRAENAAQGKVLKQLVDVFGLDAPPARIEVFDNSHISGTESVGAMIVAGPEGFIKNAYRKFNIKSEMAAGDDYAMLREVFTRRFGKAVKDETHNWPDLVLIDGGQGQLSAALEVLADLGISDLPLVAIAKGPDRNAGRERFFMPDQKPFSLPANDSALYFLQRLRDEAHRFAIGAHRSKRTKKLGTSALDEIPGIGPGRKKALLHHFGSAKAVSAAGLVDLQTVEGISKAVAQKIYDYFHG